MTSDRDQLLMSELGKLTEDDALQAFIRRHPELVRSDFVEALSDTVVKQVRVDADAALALARASCAIADELGEERDLAQAEKAMGNAFYGLAWIPIGPVALTAFDQ